MSTGDGNVTRTLETASEMLYQQETARRELLTHLGLTPLISRFDPVGAMPASRYAPPTLPMRSEASAVGEGRVAERSGPVSNGNESSAGAKALERDNDHRAAPQSNARITTEGEMQGDQLRALLRDGSGETPSRESGTIDSGRNPPPDVPHKSIVERLSLLFVITEDVLWVEQLDDYLLRTEQLQLIAAMARAIRGPTVNCEHQQFDWPPTGGLKLSQEDDLGQLLSGFLQRLVKDHQSQVLILLGSADVLPSLPMTVHRIPSSLTMLQEPSTKRDAWSVLKSLAETP